MANSSTHDIQRALAALAGDPVFQHLGVTAFRPEFGEDANGDPAVWVYVMLTDEAPLELARGPRFDERQRIRGAVHTSGWAGPVYIRFRRVSEDPSPPQRASVK